MTVQAHVIQPFPPSNWGTREAEMSFTLHTIVLKMKKSRRCRPAALSDDLIGYS